METEAARSSPPVPVHVPAPAPALSSLSPSSSISQIVSSAKNDTLELFTALVEENKDVLNHRDKVRHLSDCKLTWSVWSNSGIFHRYLEPPKLSGVGVEIGWRSKHLQLCVYSSFLGSFIDFTPPPPIAVSVSVSLFPQSGLTPLMQVSKHNFASCLQLLIGAGADVNQCDPVRDRPLFYFLCSFL
jgi:hypothetical protein